MIFATPSIHQTAFALNNPKTKLTYEQALQEFEGLAPLQFDYSLDFKEFTADTKKQALTVQSALNLFETYLWNTATPLLHTVSQLFSLLDRLFPIDHSQPPEYTQNIQDNLNKQKNKLIEKLFTASTGVIPSLMTPTPLLDINAQQHPQITQLALSVIAATKTSDALGNLLPSDTPFDQTDTTLIATIISEHYEIGAKHVNSSANLNLTPTDTPSPLPAPYLVADNFGLPSQLTASAGGGKTRDFSYMIALLTCPIYTPKGLRILKNIFDTPELFDIINPDTISLLQHIQAQASALQSATIAALTSDDRLPLSHIRLFTPGTVPADEIPPINSVAIPSNTALVLFSTLAKKLDNLHYSHNTSTPPPTRKKFNPTHYVPLVGSNPQNVSKIYQDEFGSRGVPRLSGFAYVPPMQSSRYRSFFFCEQVFLNLPLPKQETSFSSERTLNPWLPSHNRKALQASHTTRLHSYLIKDLRILQNKFRHENLTELLDFAESDVQLFALSQLHKMQALTLDPALQATSSFGKLLQARLFKYAPDVSASVVNATLSLVFKTLTSRIH